MEFSELEREYLIDFLETLGDVYIDVYVKKRKKSDKGFSKNRELQQELEDNLKTIEINSVILNKFLLAHPLDDYTEERLERCTHNLLAVVANKMRIRLLAD